MEESFYCCGYHWQRTFCNVFERLFQSAHDKGLYDTYIERSSNNHSGRLPSLTLPRAGYTSLQLTLSILTVLCTKNCIKYSRYSFFHYVIFAL